MDGSFPPLPPGTPPPPSRAPSAASPSQDVEEPAPPRGAISYAVSGVLFLATVFSVAQAGVEEYQSPWEYAAALMAILVAHEAGHYIAARVHGEPASPPFFIPLPALGSLLPRLSPFGTLGAVLFLGGRIRNRAALLDIGAAGPLAGFCLALPLVAYGLARSPLEPLPSPASGLHYVQEGQSLLYVGLKWLIHGPIPGGHDVVMHPVLTAGWVGLLVTSLNLLPIGELDGGHVSHALFGARHARIARLAALVPPLSLLYNAVVFGTPVARAVLLGAPVSASDTQTLVSAVAPWVVLCLLVAGMARWSGLEHPPTEDEEQPLGPFRKTVAWFTLGLFVLLFMPSPWVVH